MVTIMAIAIPVKGLCTLVSSGGTSTTTCGGLSPHRNCTISMNPGGGTFHLQGGTGYVLAIWVVVMGFDLPTLQAAMKEPQAQALLFWLQLCSWDVVDFAGSDILEDVILTQCKGTSLPKTLASMNVVRGSTVSLSSCTHSTNRHGSPGIGGQAFSAQCCNTLAYVRILVVVSCSSFGHQIACC